MTSVTQLFDLTGKTAVVTGGTRGIGEMIATGLLKQGARVFITSRKPDAVKAAQERLSEFGEVHAIPSDLSTNEGGQAFAKWLSEQTDAIDILVNNAGATWGAALEEFPEDGWDRVMDLNVKSIFFLTQALLPQLQAASKAAGRGRIINIGSIEGLALPMMEDTYAYPASKAAVHHLTKVMARRLARDKITVNAIAPGPFESKMTAFALSNPEGRDAVSAHIPLGRIGAPDDMIGLSAFLASPASDYVTGQIIALDGGYANLR
ncbi:Rhamnolipids biosynthesis 3-oxoacyl-(acyl-carrier-protein) reductase [Oceanicaulis sp. 350]|nr:Rhamnolipids biosynthesis 3-oxoacyl-(acyl-carrier-protein) reductase [Oceanicaulis sp. 350]